MATVTGPIALALISGSIFMCMGNALLPGRFCCKRYIINKEVVKVLNHWSKVGMEQGAIQMHRGKTLRCMRFWSLTWVQIASMC